jgi:hypothetical protein
MGVYPGERCEDMARGTARRAEAVHQLKIVLLGTKPPVWRRVTVPSGIALGSLHEVIQRAFGWYDCHLHVFEDAVGREYGPAGMEEDAFFGAVRADEEAVPLADAAPAEGDRLDYTYDFGDDWRHRITVEKVLPGDGGEAVARCTGGRRNDPPAEDIGGVWGLQTVLAMLADPEAEEDDEGYGDLVRELRERGYNPAVFDAKQLSEVLEHLPLRSAGSAAQAPRSSPSRRGPDRLTIEDLELCTCGQCQVGDPVRSMFDIALDDEDDARPVELLPAVSLPPRSELAAAARAVPLFDAALRLAAWCEPGRKVTPKGVLKPALARQAVEELELWRLDAEYHDPDVRAAALEAMRSAGDLPLIDEPWQFALAAELIETNSTTARPVLGHPAAGDAEALLECWAQALGDELYDLAEEGTGVLPGMLGAMLSGELPGSGESVVLFVELLYALPDGDWLESDGVLAAVQEGLPAQAASLLALIFGDLLRELAEILQRFGAAEVEQGAVPWNAGSGVVGILLGSPETARQPGSGDRVRLTPLGRYGLRQILLEMGHTAPVVGEYADSDAATLLGVLPAYGQDAAEREVGGWLARRSPADAAVQIVDACAGTDADASARRRTALPVLAQLADERALRVLRKAAASEVDGCRQVAAGALHVRGEEVAGHGEATALWLMIDNLVLPVADPAELAAYFDEEDGLARDGISQVADVLWRSDHPATVEVLQALGEALKSSDKKLAKRLRTSANKAQSRQ